MHYCKERLECKNFNPARCDSEQGTGCFELRSYQPEPVDNYIPVLLFPDDWKDLCIVLGSLTWGEREIMDRWHNLRDRVNKRNRLQ